MKPENKECTFEDIPIGALFKEPHSVYTLVKTSDYMSKIVMGSSESWIGTEIAFHKNVVVIMVSLDINKDIIHKEVD